MSINFTLEHKEKNLHFVKKKKKYNIVLRQRHLGTRNCLPHLLVAELIYLGKVKITQHNVIFTAL